MYICVYNSTTYKKIDTDCPQKLELLFIIDVSSSVTNTDPQNRERTRNFLFTVIELWYNIQAAILETSVENVNDTNFGIIYYSRESTIHLDFSTPRTMQEYLDIVEDLFDETQNPQLYTIDDTATALALNDSLHVFENSPNWGDASWNRLAMLITDGVPTIPEFEASPCDDVYGFADRFEKSGMLLLVLVNTYSILVYIINIPVSHRFKCGVSPKVCACVCNKCFVVHTLLLWLNMYVV